MKELGHLSAFFYELTMVAYHGVENIALVSVVALTCSGALSVVWLANEWQRYMEAEWPS